jgi:hypothetical protein
VEEGKAVEFSDESHFELQLRERSGCWEGLRGQTYNPKFTKMSVKDFQKSWCVGNHTSGRKVMGELRFSNRVR